MVNKICDALSVILSWQTGQEVKVYAEICVSGNGNGDRSDRG